MEIKKIFLTKKNKEPEVLFSETEDQDDPKVRITYYQSGYGAAIKAMGSAINFKACLENLYGSFEQQCRDQEAQQIKLKQPYFDEKSRKHSELKNVEAAISIFEENKQQISHKINIAKFEIEDVNHHPEVYGIESTKRPKAQFYIGILILIPITLYLFVFYISATYSAFFKDFANDSLSAAIFDAQAFNNALDAGWLEAVLIFTIPSVFLGLGFIIHMLQKGKGIKNIFRIIALFFVTFLFDGLLAYQIEKKIYEFNKTPDSLPYNLNVAIGEAEFWMIIFAGFVVYIIWGLVFDITMKEHENLDKIKGFIDTKLEEMKSFEITKNELSDEINSLKRKLVEITGKISELQAAIDGFVLNLKQYLLYHHQYKEGWFQAVTSEIALPLQKQNEILLQCEDVANIHLKDLNLINPDFQSVVYSKIS
ncbi:MAG: ABC transporter permease [Flavobacterium sp.]|nr:MAG: ABC transporter permease [Flavobacterium sp.]